MKNKKVTFLSSKLNFLGSPRLPLLLLPIMMIYLVVGTVEQKYIGLYEATKIYFTNPVMWAWDIIPLPGFPVWVALLLVGLLAQLLTRSRWTKQMMGTMLVHIGVVLLLGGGLITSIFSYEGYMPLLQDAPPSTAIYDYEEGQMRVFATMQPARQLPFALSLEQFEKELHAGTNVASAYQSKVKLHDAAADQTWTSLIRMNEPLRYKGYTFYQSSYVFTPDGQVISILAVVHNVGRIFPYLSCLIVALGLLLHLIIRWAGRRRGVKV